MGPLVRCECGQRVGCVDEQVVVPVGDAGLYLSDFLADRDQRVAESIQLVQRFALGGSSIIVLATGNDIVGA